MKNAGDRPGGGFFGLREIFVEPSPGLALASIGAAETGGVTMTTLRDGAPPARMTVVTAPACHFCHDALDALGEVGRDFPLQITELDVRAAAGADLMARHGAGMIPLVLLDDRFVSAGRLPRNKLRKLLAARAAGATVAAGVAR